MPVIQPLNILSLKSSHKSTYFKSEMDARCLCNTDTSQVTCIMQTEPFITCCLSWQNHADMSQVTCIMQTKHFRSLVHFPAHNWCKSSLLGVYIMFRNEPQNILELKKKLDTVSRDNRWNVKDFQGSPFTHFSYQAIDKKTYSTLCSCDIRTFPVIFQIYKLFQFILHWFKCASILQN